MEDMLVCGVSTGGELFVADTPEEVERLAREKHPDEMPQVRYIFREKRSRIHGNGTWRPQPHGRAEFLSS